MNTSPTLRGPWNNQQIEEYLEPARYPVRLREFSVRECSGGAGRYRGGDGVTRKLEFLEPMQAAILRRST